LFLFSSIFLQLSCSSFLYSFSALGPFFIIALYGFEVLPMFLRVLEMASIADYCSIGEELSNLMKGRLGFLSDSCGGYLCPRPIPLYLTTALPGES
jgi:hypothetical protein